MHGGIGTAPKFPQPAIFELLWRAYKRTKTAELKQAVTVTLDRMSQGGIYDHLGGGYARYSTDAHWLAPHFEKMLYDNAQLLELLALVWSETKAPLYAQRAAETVGWLQREMMARGRRVRGDAGRGFRRRRGQVLCLGRGRDRRAARARRGVFQGGV